MLMTASAFDPLPYPAAFDVHPARTSISRAYRGPDRRLTMHGRVNVCLGATGPGGAAVDARSTADRPRMIRASRLSWPAEHDDLRRPPALRRSPLRPPRRRVRVAEPDPGAGHPRAARGQGRDRPGPD